jgi:hypothetical protein
LRRISGDCRPRGLLTRPNRRETSSAAARAIAELTLRGDDRGSLTWFERAPDRGHDGASSTHTSQAIRRQPGARTERRNILIAGASGRQVYPSWPAREKSRD